MVGGLVAAALADLTQLLLQSNSDNNTLVFLAMLGGGLVIVYSGFNSWKRMRLIQDTATEKVRSAAAGRTEVNGSGTPIGEPIQRPFGDEDCLVASYKIERWEEDHDHDDDDAGRDGHWETIDDDTLYGPFQLDDGTGTMRVEPDGSTMFKYDGSHSREIKVGGGDEEPPEIVSFLEQNDSVSVPDRDGLTGRLFSNRRRYTEKWIPVGQQLYAFGGAEPTEPDETTSSGLVLRQDEASEEFIVSQKSEEVLVSEAKWQAPMQIVVGLIVSAAGLYFLLSGGA